MFDHHQFVAAVRRRAILALAAEQAAVTAAVLLAPASVALRLAHLNRPLSIGLACAVVTTVAVARVRRRWPTTWSAAMIADRHFGWNDLLPTACVADPRDPFAIAVQRSADARCAAHQPREVPTAALSRRAWAGVAAAVLLAATVVAWPTRSPPSIAALRPADQPTDVLVAAADPVARDDPSTGTNAADPRHPPPTASLLDERSTSIPMADPTAAPVGRPGGPRGTTGGTGAGQAGMATTGSPRPTDPTAAPPTVDRGDALAAGGASAPAAVGRDDLPGRSAAPSASAIRPPIPLGPLGPGPAGSADQQVPIRDRPLVRAYFDTPAAGQ